MSTQELTPRSLQALSAVISLSILMDVVLAIVLVQFVPPSIADSGMEMLLGGAFAAISIVAVFGAFRVRQATATTFQQKSRLVLVALAISELPAILGLVHALLTASLPVAMILCGISGAAAILLFPRKAWLEQ